QDLRGGAGAAGRTADRRAADRCVVQGRPADGPGPGGLVLGRGGPGLVFIINAVSFAATIGAMMVMRTGELRHAPRMKKAKGQLREGLAYVRHSSDIVMIMAVVVIIGGIGVKVKISLDVMYIVAIVVCTEE